MAEWVVPSHQFLTMQNSGVMYFIILYSQMSVFVLIVSFYDVNMWAGPTVFVIPVNAVYN